MNRETMFAAYATLLILAGTPALAEEQTTQRTTQQQGVQVDAQTGTVTQQKNIHQDTRKEQSSPSGVDTRVAPGPAGGVSPAGSGLQSPERPLPLTQLPQPPSDAELISRLAKVGVPAGEAQAALDKWGAVKVNAIVAREEQKRAALAADPQLAADAQPPMPGADAEAPLQTENDPYKQLRELKAANVAAPAEADRAEQRGTKAAGYMDAVHAAEGELKKNSPNGLECSGDSCLVQP